MKDNNNKPPLKQMIETFTTVEEKDDPSPKTNNDI